MRQYELAIRIAQVHHLAEEKKYKKALAVIETLDMRQVKSLSDLKVFAKVYTKTEQFEAAKATYLRIYRRSRTRNVLHRLVYLSIRTHSFEDAEMYYQEYLSTNPSARDALILRYRIDKASGAPIGTLIETLQELKQEEYIEEWAYELAKLYHRAGRRQECLEECRDIRLWFGSGEIVERAKILIDHLEERDPLPYYDDKDFTVPEPEEPNPEDTGSLPALDEYIGEAYAAEDEREDEYQDEYRDEYRDKLTDQWQNQQEDELTDQWQDQQEDELTEKPHFSQSGTGITQDLAREISAIYEMEHREQLQEKAVTVVEDAPDSEKDAPNIAVDVVDRMTQAIRNRSQHYVPQDIEEIEAPKKKDTKDFSGVAERVRESTVSETEDDVAEQIEKPETDSDCKSLEDTKDLSPLQANGQETVKDVEAAEAAETPKAAEVPETAETAEAEETSDVAEAMEHYQAPEIPVVETEYGQVSEIAYEDLPTTRALHTSFRDVLTLIAGELDPSHFVLLGDGEERIVGISKQIVKVMCRTGYLSAGRIAKVDAVQLNSMDLIGFRSQLKGNCLLIEQASELLFPTITKIFSVMEEYYGDFVVIFVDEGQTLDQLFRFVPALARKFKYIIDISQYTEADYSDAAALE